VRRAVRPADIPQLNDTEGQLVGLANLGMSSSNVEWRRWGEIDPLFGVAAAKGRERGGASPWTDGEFYERGARHWPPFTLLGGATDWITPPAWKWDAEPVG